MPRWYVWLWKRIGGRPWTYIIRDFSHENPLLLILAGLTGVCFMLNIQHEIAWVLLGVLLGHLFWGTEWHKGQKGDCCAHRRWLGGYSHGSG
jgi:hypothetical protein